MLDKQTENVTDFLVQLYDTHRLYALSKNNPEALNKTDARLKLVSLITSLFDTTLNLREAELISDVLISLTRKVERDIRQKIAEKLAASDDIPLRLILHFANDDIDVAEHILIKSSVLNQTDLIYIIQSCGFEHWRAIAKREDINGGVIDMLAETKDKGTINNLADNDKILITPFAYEIMEEMAEEDEKLAERVIKREDMPQSVALKLYQSVTNDIKEQICRRFPDLNLAIIEQTTKEAVEELSSDCTDKKTQKEIESNAINYANKLKKAGLLSLAAVLDTLHKGQVESFIAQFSVYTNIPFASMKDVLTHTHGQGLVAICKAHSINKQDFIGIYLLTNGLRNGGKYISRHDINQASIYYNKMSHEVARKLLAKITPEK